MSLPVLTCLRHESVSVPVHHACRCQRFVVFICISLSMGNIYRPTSSPHLIKSQFLSPIPFHDVHVKLSFCLSPPYPACSTRSQCISWIQASPYGFVSVCQRLQSFEWLHQDWGRENCIANRCMSYNCFKIRLIFDTTGCFFYFSALKITKHKEKLKYPSCSP